MKLGRCALCLKTRKLEKSHIIPNSAFKPIKRELSGKVITVIDDKDTWVKYTNDSWWEYLLCSDCEDIFEKYETYSLGILKGAKKIEKVVHEQGVTFKNINYGEFKLFLTSVLWRASVSKQDVFSKVILHPSWAEEARLSLLNKKALPPLKLGCKLSKLNDPVPGGTFTEESLQQFVISPIPRRNRRTVSFLFAYSGYLFEYFSPAILYGDSRSKGVLKKSCIFLIPYQSITGVPELLDVMVSGLEKDVKGMVKFKS